MPNFFLADLRHKRLKNIIDLLLRYRENFYGFLESENEENNSILYDLDNWLIMS